ncbi:MAG: 1,2-phenylacetyl-CoA epoxidase subunit PaaC [Egibacteraceae bacterium]
MSEPRLTLLLALADDELVIGHRHLRWTGVAPHIEEDLAFSSIAQDEIGHAVVWLGLAGELGHQDPDQLGLGRSPDEYRHAVLCERPNRDWAFTLARQYCYDLADDVRLEALASSSWRAVANATGALRREERYHLLHARTWLDRLASGPQVARAKLAEGLTATVAEAAGLFEALPGEGELVAAGILPVGHDELLTRWRAVVGAELEPYGLGGVLKGLGGGLGGRHGRHSEDFTQLWEEMTGLYRAYPGARW